MPTFIMLLALAVPPPHPSAVAKIAALPDKPTVSRVLKDRQNPAPIPDELKDRFVEVETFDAAGVTIELEVPETTGLVRLPGPSYQWPHGSCAMCLGNSLTMNYGQSQAYLNEIGYDQWEILWDNLHNDPAYEGVKGENQGGYDGSSYGTQRRGLFRWRR